MLRAWRKKQDPATQAMVEGDLTMAVEILRKHPTHNSMSRRKTATQLTQALIERAGQAKELGNLQQAWSDLYSASEIALPGSADQLAREKTHLVELTIEQADSLLSQAKITAALDTVDHLRRRKIPDRRADQIHSASQLIRSAEEAAAKGNLTRSTRKIEQAQSLRPDLAFLDHRKKSYRVQLQKLAALNNELRGAFAVCDWQRAQTVAGKILTIAPKYKIALDATQQCRDFLQADTVNIKFEMSTEQTNQELNRTQFPAREHKPTGSQKMTINLSDTHYRDSSAGINANPDGTGSEPTVPRAAEQGGASDNAKNQSGNELSDAKSVPTEKVVFIDDPAPKDDPFSEFMMWVDGVGGYLVCPAPVNTIGQAIEQSHIEIPIIGDVQRRHVRLEMVEGHHLLYALGGTAIDRTQVNPGDGVTLRDGQRVKLDGGVEFAYLKRHPLSPTARLEFLSRHRTRPWSDGVILATQSIILGPDRRNHVVCPFWEHDVVMFRRGNQWFCRTEGKLEVDGKIYAGTAPINLASQISGMDFNFSLEPVQSTHVH